MCDSHDDRADFSKMNIPEDVIKFYESKNPYYAELLSGELDDTVAWERYEEERLENAILVKEGFSDYSFLYFMPEYKEDDPHVRDDDAFQIYDYNDTTDSITGMEYPNKEGDIVANYDGFSMLVMQSQEYDDAYDIYYEGSRRYARLGGSYWTCMSDATFFGGNEYVKYFYDKYDYRLMFICKGKPFDIDSGEVKLSEDVENITELRTDNVTLGQNDGLISVVKYIEGGYSVFYVSVTDYKTRTIIDKDWPANGENFEISKDEKGFFIEGKLNRYYLGNDWETSNAHGIKLRGASYTESSNDHVFVNYFEDDEQFIGIYKISEQKLIVKNAKGFSDYGSYANLKFRGYSRLFDYIREVWVSEPFSYGYAVHSGDYYIHNTIGNTNNMYIYDVYIEQEHGPFDDIERVLNRRNGVVCIVIPHNTINKPRRYTLYNTNTGQYIVDKQYTEIRVVSAGLCVGRLDGEPSDLINIMTGKIESQIRGSMVEPVGPDIRDFSKMFYTFQKPDGKYNIYSGKHGIVLPNDVGIILPWTASNLVPFADNGRLYMLHIDNEDNTNLLPTKEGIQLNRITGVHPRKTYEGSIEDVGFDIKMDDSSTIYSALYDVESNTIKRVESVQTYYKTGNKNVADPAILQQIEHIFFPERAQISENFRKIMDRMNNL
jgi:hypothetical protein